MPASYTNAKNGNVTNTRVVLYTTPAGATAIVNCIHVTAVAVDTTFSAWAGGVQVANAVDIPLNNPFELTDRNPYVLTAGETVEVQAGAAGNVAVLLSALEET